MALGCEIILQPLSLAAKIVSRCEMVSQPPIHPHQSHLLQLSQGLLYPLSSIEAYATLSRHWPLLRASSLSKWQLSVLIRSRLSPLRPNTLPSWGRFGIIWVLYQFLSMPFLAHQSHHRPFLSSISLYLLRSPLQKSQRQLSHHLHIIIQPPSDHFDVFFIFPFYISIMYFLYEIPCFWYYILGLLVLLVLHFVLTWIEVIQIYHFLITLSIILFYFLYSYLLLFLKHVVAPVNIRNWYHSGGTTSSL